MDDPRDFLAVARLFITPGAKIPATALGYRTAISRSYYALYNVVCEVLDRAEIEILQRYKGHDLAKQVLMFCNDEIAKAVGHDLKSLQQQRWSADYDMKDKTIGSERTAIACVKQATEAIENLDTADFDALKQHLKQWVQAHPGNGLKNKT